MQSVFLVSSYKHIKTNLMIIAWGMGTEQYCSGFICLQLSQCGLDARHLLQPQAIRSGLGIQSQEQALRTIRCVPQTKQNKFQLSCQILLCDQQFSLNPGLFHLRPSPAPFYLSPWSLSPLFLWVSFTFSIKMLFQIIVIFNLYFICMIFSVILLRCILCVCVCVWCTLYHMWCQESYLRLALHRASTFASDTVSSSVQ